MIKKQQGLTLLELLVVLVLVGLLSTMLMQGFSYMFGIYNRVNNFQQEARQTTLTRAWLKQTLVATVPQLDIGRAFTGDNSELSAITLQPLSAQAGVPMPFSWSLEIENGWVILNYREGNSVNWQIDKWRGDQASFHYLDQKGEWKASWPEGGTAPLLIPQAIELSTIRKNRPFSVLVSLDNFPLAEDDFRDTVAKWNTQ